MFAPFTCHWYEGVGPPFTGVAVKVTDVFRQTLLSEAKILTEGVTVEFTVRFIVLILSHPLAAIRVSMYVPAAV